MTAPIPAARRPGTRTSPIIGPPIPDPSINRKAPVSGEPSRVLIAAKLPEAPTTWMDWAGRSRFTARTTAVPPAPAQGDQRGLGPDDRPESEAGQCGRAMPGSSIAGATPPAWKPSAGE